MNVLAFVAVCLVILFTLAGACKKDPPPPKSTAPPKSSDHVARQAELTRSRARNHLG